MTTPLFVLFDLGNVLVRIHPEAFGVRLGLAGPVARGRYVGPVKELVREYEIGSITTDRYLDALYRLFEGRHTLDTLRQAMHDVIAEPMEGMDRLVQKVAASVPVGLVSNTNEMHFRQSLESVPALRFMRSYFLSYELKALKPDPSYYAAVLQRLSCPPATTVFIDDLEENVRGAAEAGMRGIHFGGLDELQDNLKEFGLLKG